MTSLKEEVLAPAALTIAGSDCSGGAGLQADLKTFTAHRVYGMAAVTCIVAENPKKVVSIQPVTPRALREQIACCLKDMPPTAVKTGMLFSASLIQAVRIEISNFKPQISNLIVDPVMVATSGRRLLKRDAVRALKNLLLEEADLVTPNLQEAEILAERRIRTQAQVEAAAIVMARRFECAVLLKGGHLQDLRWASDFLWDGHHGHWFRAAWIRGVRTHGTGCTYSAAITARLARGHSMIESARRAKRYVTAAIRASCRFQPWMALNHALPNVLD